MYMHISRLKITQGPPPRLVHSFKEISEVPGKFFHNYILSYLPGSKILSLGFLFVAVVAWLISDHLS